MIIIKKQIDIEKRPTALKRRDDGLHLHPAWKTIINDTGITRQTYMEKYTNE